MRYLLHVFSAAAILLASGAMHGHYTGRWNQGAQHRAVQRLEALPRQIGPWTQVDEQPLDPVAVEILQCHAYVNRVYRHQVTRATVGVTLLVGPGNTIAVHAPEICLGGKNYLQLGSREPLALDRGGEHTFWAVGFRRNAAAAQPIQVVYGWSEGDRWVAPERPRLAVAGVPLLYKLQVTDLQYQPQADDSSPVGRDFLQAFLSYWAETSRPATILNHSSSAE